MELQATQRNAIAETRTRTRRSLESSTAPPPFLPSLATDVSLPFTFSQRFLYTLCFFLFYLLPFALSYFLALSLYVFCFIIFWHFICARLLSRRYSLHSLFLSLFVFLVYFLEVFFFFFTYSVSFSCVFFFFFYFSSRFVVGKGTRIPWDKLWRLIRSFSYVKRRTCMEVLRNMLIREYLKCDISNRIFIILCSSFRPLSYMGYLEK